MKGQNLPAQDLLPLTPAVFNILLALADGEKHGYAIMNEVEASTLGEIKMGPGTLYGSIKRMISAGLIEETEERPDPMMDDQRRRYYRLNAQGMRVLKAEAERLARQVELARLKHVLEEVRNERSAEDIPFGACLSRPAENLPPRISPGIWRSDGSGLPGPMSPV